MNLKVQMIEFVANVRFIAMKVLKKIHNLTPMTNKELQANREL
jgi:hypothetical protein